MLYIDTETTGLVREGVEDLSLQPRIIEIAAVHVWRIDRNGWLGETVLNTLVNPGVPIPPEVTKITGITDDMVKDAPPFVNVIVPLVEAFRGDADQATVGHNVGFDLQCLIFELRRLGLEHRFPWHWRQIDTVPLSGGKKLKVWAQEVMGDRFPGQVHRALDDVRLLIECHKTVLA